MSKNTIDLNFRAKRLGMISEIEDKYAFRSPRVFKVMRQLPRHKFVEKKYRDISYEDRPVPIGEKQTMSQPYTVAFMTYLLLGKKEQQTENEKDKKTKALEVGTGSGYQAAILSKLFDEVYTIEIIPELARRARTVLSDLGYHNVHVKKGSGEWGWKEKAPFDAIMVTAGAEKIPNELITQLRSGGRLVIPVGEGDNKIMTRITKQKKGKIKKEEFGVYHFVPFTRE